MRVIINILCLLLTGTLLAQDINKAEYFFDTDPGVGNGIDIPVSPAGMMANLTDVFDASGLSAGYHTVSVRVRTSNNRWSHLQGRRFFHEPVLPTPTIYKVTAAEYFFDNTDPGKGMATAIPISQAAETVNLMDSIAIAGQGLSVGIHTISMRFKSDFGLWGNVETRTFEVCASDAPIAKFEYTLVGDKLTIIDKSQNAASYLYDFGDGNTSTMASPIYTYVSTGTFNVCQTVTNTCGSDMFCEQIQQSNVAPTISNPIADVTRAEDSGTYTVASNLNTIFTDDNFDQLTFTVTSSNPSNVVASINGNSLTITPASNFNGTANITVTADDGALNVSDQFMVTITPVNDAPTVFNGIPNQTKAEDSGPWTIATLTNGIFVDADGDNLSYTASSDNTDIMTSINNNQLILSSTTDYFGTGNITVTASDGSLSVDDVFTMTITSVNDAPTAGANGLPNKEIQEGAGLTTLFSNLNDFITDPEGDAFTYNINAGQYTNNFTLTGSQLQVEMPANYAGSFTVIVETDDGQASANIPFLLTVTEINDAPVLDNPISDKFYNENSGSHVVVSDLNMVFSDPENSNLTFSATSSNTNITVTINGNSLSVNSTANFTGFSNIIVTASDGTLMKNDEFKVTYIPIPSPSDISHGEYWFDVDPGQGNGTPFLFPNPGNNVNTTDIFDASGLSEGYHKVGVRVRTGAGVWSHMQSRTFYVEGVSTPPISNKIIAAEYFFDTDPGQGNATTINIGGATEIVNLTNTINIVSAGLTEGEHSLNIRFQSDNGLWSNIESRTFNYCNSTIPTSSFDYTLIGNTLTLNNQSSNVMNTIWIFGDGNGSTEISPVHNYSTVGSYEVCLVNINGCVRDTLCQMVQQTNVAPTLTTSIADMTINEDAGMQLLVANLSTYFTDANGDNLTYTISENNGNILTNLNGNQIQATPDANYFGSTIITVCANDGQLDFCTNFTLTIAPINDAPTATTIPTVTIQEDGGAQLTIGNLDAYFSDIDGDNLTYTVSSDNSNIESILQTNTMIQALPTTDFNGSATFTVSASDGVTSTSQTFTVIVSPVNDTPQLVNNIPDASITNTGGNQIVVSPLSAYFTDVDGDNLTYTLSSDNSNVMVNLSNGNIEASTSNGYEGTATIMVTASDGSLSAIDDFIITVTNIPNNAPIVSSPISDFSFDEDAGPQVAVADVSNSFSDSDQDALTYTVTSDNSSITISLDGTQISANSAMNYNGIATITVTATDGTSSVSDQFIVTINPVNDTPVNATTILTQSIQEDGGSQLVISGLNTYFEDVDGDMLMYSVSSDNLNVSLPNQGVNSIYAEPSTDFNGTATITVLASDGIESVSQQFQLIIEAVNDAPTILATIPDATIFNEGGIQTVVNSLSSHFIDVDGDNLTYSLNNDNSDVIVNIIGNKIEASAPGFEGTTLVTVSATDGILTVVDEFIITVNSNQNNAPIVINPIEDISLNEDAGEQILAYLSMVFSDPDNDNMVFAGVSSNPEISVTLDGDEVIIQSNPDYFGTTVITITAYDNGLSITDEFIVTILPVNDAPTISTLENQVMNEGDTLSGLVFTINDVDDVLAGISFSATSSDTNILPNENLVVTDNGNIQVLTINPVYVSSSSTIIINLEATDGELIGMTSFELTIDDLTATQIVDLSSTALLSPNPTEDYLILSLGNDLKGTFDVQITDALGRLVLLEKVEKDTHTWSHRLDVNQLGGGIYYLRILKENKLLIKQFIKM